MVFIFASKGYSILYLFLLADLFCCAAVVTIFYGFFNKKINSQIIIFIYFKWFNFRNIFFPSQNFQTSILVGNLFSIELF